MTIQDVLTQIKELYEKAIRKSGIQGKTKLIRSQKLINLLHEYVKDQLVAKGVDPTKIYPPQKHSKPELKMSGLIKTKDQDICVLPNPPISERINSEGPLEGEIDEVGYDNTCQAISINIRSQLSKVNSNYDTIIERTIAEALNLHLRAPSLVMGELFLLPTIAYDIEAMRKKHIGFKEKVKLTRYIRVFQHLNGRSDINDAEYKYERVGFLIVDFQSDEPKLTNDVDQLIKGGLVKEAEGLSLEGLSIDGLIDDLFEQYKERHKSLKNLQH